MIGCVITQKDEKGACSKHPFLLPVSKKIVTCIGISLTRYNRYNWRHFYNKNLTQDLLVALIKIICRILNQND